MRPLGVLLASLALALSIALYGLGRVDAQEPLTVTGTVINGTAGAALPTQVQVLALVTGAEGGVLSTSLATAGDEGRFELANLPAVADARYALAINHSGALYTRAFSLEELSDDIVLNIYETTTDATVVRVTHHLSVVASVDPTEREVTLVDFVTLVNDSDRTLQPDLSVPAQMSFLRFSLPPLAETLALQSDMPGGDIVSVGTGFAVTSQVTPGQHNVEFSYKIPYQGDSLTYRQAFHQGADIFQVLVPDRLRGLDVSPLQRVASPNLDGTVYDAWEARDLSRSEEVMVTLSSLPQPGMLVRLEKWAGNGVLWQVAIPAILGVVLAGLLVWGGLRPSSGRHPSPAPTSTATARDNYTLINEIAALDDSYSRGDLDDAEYHSTRQTLKGRFLDTVDSTDGRELQPTPSRATGDTSIPGKPAE